ncbi:protein amalgam-like [Babylonia areolata]|uniref:protein amalgam-like n=1 Tax=Babylonia areolata TaxID=304850 RepID=UPI003FD027E8
METRFIMRSAGLWSVLGVLTVLLCLSEVSGARMSRRISMTFEMGRDATLNCTVRGIGKKRVIWRRLADPVPIAVGTTKFTAGKKYRVRRKGDDWQLIIKNVDHSDAGEYECRLTGRDDVADILSIIIPSASHPHFQPKPTSVTARVGGHAVLPCFVNNLRKSLVLWMKEPGKVLTLRKKTHSGDKRHKVLHTQRPEWSLQIRKLRPEDFGVYTCVVGTVPPITRTVTLVQQGSGQDKEPEQGEGADKLPELGHSTDGNPQLVKETFKSQVDVLQYQSMTLTCQFKGDPKPTVVWERRVWTPLGEKKVEDLKTQGETYTLTNAQPHDSGVYVCKASNRKPPPGQGRIRVKVKEVITTTTPKPTTTVFDPVGNAAPRAYAMDPVVYQRRGRDAELSCKAVGVPRPQVNWLTGGGQPVEESHKFKVFNLNARHHTVYSTLHVRSLITSDFRNYTCYVLNNYGHDQASFMLAKRVS